MNGEKEKIIEKLKENGCRITKQRKMILDIILENLPYEHIRWIENPGEVDVAKIQGTSDMKRICDLKGNPLLLFINSWSVGMVEERNPKLKLAEFGRN